MPIRPSRAGGQLKFSRLLNWQISGLRAVEYFGYVEPDLTKISRGVYAVGDESTCLDVTLKDEHGRQPLLDRQFGNTRAEI